MASADVPRDRPRYVQLRKGRWYWEPPLRLRRSAGLKVVALGADAAAAFAAARKLNRELAGLDPGAAAPGTVAWLFEEFFRSDKFGKLAASTRKDYRWLAGRIGGLELGSTTLGRCPARSVKARHADKIHGILEKESGQAAAHYACRFARRVWNWARRQEHVDPEAANPWAEMSLGKLPERDQRWTPEQVEAFCAKARDLGWPSQALAVQLSYWLAHRQGDVLHATWTDLEKQARRTRKTRAEVPVVASVYPELAAALATVERRHVQVVVCESTDRPWKADHFRHVFRQIADAAGLPEDLQFRDLRATAATELADAGATVPELRSHGGWTNAAMALRYARATTEQFRGAAERRLNQRGGRRGKGPATDEG